MLLLFRAGHLSRMRRKFHALKFTESRAPMSYRAIVIAGLATVSPKEHPLIIRDVPPDERDQFRIHWNVRSKV